MNRDSIIAARVAAEQPSPRPRKRLDGKTLAGLVVACALFLGFAWFVLGEDGHATRAGVRVDALKQNAGDRYGMLTARGPEVEAPEREAAPEQVSMMTKPGIAPMQPNSEGLKKALASVEKLNERIADLQGELTDAKIELNQKTSELETIRLALDRLQDRYDAREKRFQTELSKAVAEAEARALEGMSQLQSQGLTEDERRRLDELKRLRERQNQSDGIVFDQTPYGRNGRSR